MIKLWLNRVSSVKLLDAGEGYTHGEEPFKPTIK